MLALMDNNYNSFGRMDEPLDEASSKPDLMKVMEEKLPPYIRKCFLAAGFDTFEVISSMDVSESEGNSIAIIEGFIGKYYSGNPEFYGSPTPNLQCPFLFPPGHRLRICSFVSEVKCIYQQALASKRKRKLWITSSVPKKRHQNASSALSGPSGLPKIASASYRGSSTESEGGELTISSVSNQIRVSIAKWLKKQQNPKLKSLKENKHFTINVLRHPESRVLSVFIRCIPCTSGVHLSPKNDIYLISNWTRHIKLCEQIQQPQKPLTKQNSLKMFFSPNSSISSDTSSFCEETSSFAESLGSIAHSPIRDGETSSVPSSEAPSLPNQNTSEIESDAPPTEDFGPKEQLNTIDWSRGARMKRKLERISDDIDQTHITDFFSILDKIDSLVIENKKLASLIQHVSIEDQSACFSLTPVLRQLITNAQKNAQCLPTGRRHSEILKKFSTSLLIYAGPLAYNFLHENLPQALPSLRTVQRIIHSEYNTISEGEFRFDELATHISQNKAPNAVTIGEDATRLISRVEWDAETNRCCGFVLPVNEMELPVVDSFLALTFEGIERMFMDNKISNYAYVYMAQPLMDGCPPFCLMIMGTNNKFTARSVLLRWCYIVDECKKRNIHVLSIGGDGDSRLLKAMKLSTDIFSSARSDLLSSHSPCSSLTLSGIPSEWKAWFHVQPSSLAFVQDTVHVAVKLKSRLLRPSSLIPMGRFVAGLQHLRMIQSSFGKDLHGLRERDLNHKDKQKF